MLDAAERVFIRRGLRGSSVEEIAAEAGFTRGAFYSNFKSKDELFVELLQDRVYRQYAEMAEQAQEQPGSPRQRLRWGVERVRDVQTGTDGNWLFRLWLECLTQAARDEGFRELGSDLLEWESRTSHRADEADLRGAGSQATAAG